MNNTDNSNNSTNNSTNNNTNNPTEENDKIRPSNKYFSTLNVPNGKNGIFEESGTANNNNNNIIKLNKVSNDNSNKNNTNEVAGKYLSTNIPNNLSGKGSDQLQLNSNEININKEKIDKMTENNSSINKIDKLSKKEKKLEDDKKDKTVGINNPTQMNNINTKPTNNKSESSVPAIKIFSNKDIVKIKDMLNTKK